IARAAGPDVPVLGFAAAPWTLACYLVEGRTRGELSTIKRMMYTEPSLLHALLEKIAHATSRYLKMQLAAGAAAVQIFDTWAGELSAHDYEVFELRATQQLIAELNAGTAPVILYAKNGAHLLSGLARTGATVLSVDWRTDLAEARGKIGAKIALQGNVDPAMLLSTEENVEWAVREAITKTNGTGHILNLGHGILPTTPVANAQAFVRAAREFSQAKPPQAAAAPDTHNRRARKCRLRTKCRTSKSARSFSRNTIVPALATQAIPPRPSGMTNFIKPTLRNFFITRNPPRLPCPFICISRSAKAFVFSARATSSFKKTRRPQFPISNRSKRKSITSANLFRDNAKLSSFTGAVARPPI